MIISVDVQDSDWKGSLDRLVVLMEEAGRDASLMAAQEIQDITRGKLEARSHGKYEVTNSPPGEPPAMVSGDLSASIAAEMMTEDEAWVGPTAGFRRSGDYARIQELGGPMHGHPFMVWFKEFDGVMTRFEREFVELPARPYLEPSTEDMINSGRLTEIYIEHWTYAIEEAG